MKIIFLLVFVGTAWASGVRELNLKPKDIGTIQTSVGYSTVIQFSEKPVNVVIGNQAAFRVEFIKNSVTIKPVINGARTNLFVFTENDRFNLTVVASGSGGVDYVVRVKRIFEDPSQGTLLNRSMQIAGVKLILLRKVKARDGVFIDFEVNNLSDKKHKLIPEAFRLVRGSTVESVKSVYVDTPHLAPKSSIHGSLYVNRDPTDSAMAVWIGFEGQKPMKFSFAGKRNQKKESMYAF